MAATVLTATENLPYEDWLEYRKLGIGGSDASVVCGISRYKSPVELWMEKTGQLPQQEAGEAAYWGTQLEPLVRLEFSKRTGIEVSLEKQLLQSEEHPFMLANLDGVCQHPEVGPCIFEAKTASAYKAGEWEDAIPDEYQLQIQHYMAVTGYRGAYIAALISGNTFKWRFVERDEELIAMLIELETDFWHHVLWQKIFLPSNAPPEFLDLQQLCDEIEGAEVRWDARTARQFIASLPNELPPGELVRIVSEFVASNFVSRNLCAITAIHRGTNADDPSKNNPHVHIVVPTRTVGADGFCRKKDREHDKKEYITIWRKQWADVQNRAYERNRLDIRVSHESLEVLGQHDREPTIHLSRIDYQKEQRGERTPAGDRKRAIRSRNEERIQKRRTEQERQLEMDLSR